MQPVDNSVDMCITLGRGCGKTYQQMLELWKNLQEGVKIWG